MPIWGSGLHLRDEALAKAGQRTRTSECKQLGTTASKAFRAVIESNGESVVEARRLRQPD
jgi:hypothetical protein